MERKFRYGLWKTPELYGMEDFKNEMEDNLPYFHTNFIVDFVHCIYKKYIPTSGSDKRYCHRSIQLQWLRVIFVDKWRYFGNLYCANSVRIASL